MSRYVIEHGDVWFKREGRLAFGNNKTHVCDGTGELAIALLDDVMLKCGSAESVDAWARAKASGVHDLTIIRFPVSEETVAELNACLENSTRAAHIMENLEAIGRSNPGLADRPRYPR